MSDATIPKADVIEAIRLHLKEIGHPLQHRFMNALTAYEGRQRNITSIDFKKMFDLSMMRMPAACELAPGVVGGKEKETLAQLSAHSRSCEDCRELHRDRHSLRQAVYAAAVAYSTTGSVQPATATVAIPGPEDGIEVYCAACGKPFRAIRMSARTCSTACRTALYAKRKKAQS
jgi:hypothetical protein